MEGSREKAHIRLRLSPPDILLSGAGLDTVPGCTMRSRKISSSLGDQKRNLRLSRLRSSHYSITYWTWWERNNFIFAWDHFICGWIVENDVSEARRRNSGKFCITIRCKKFRCKISLIEMLGCRTIYTNMPNILSPFFITGVVWIWNVGIQSLRQDGFLNVTTV